MSTPAIPMELCFDRSSWTSQQVSVGLADETVGTAPRFESVEFAIEPEPQRERQGLPLLRWV